MAVFRTVVALKALVTFLAMSALTAKAEPPADQEPPLLLYLESDGKRIPIELDKPFGLEALAGKKKAVLRAEPYRVFQHAGLSFRYPRSYLFDADHENPDITRWSLEGTSFLIMVQKFLGTRDHAKCRQDLLDELNTQYAGSKTRESDARLDLKGSTLEGRRIEVTLANNLLHQDVFSFAVGDSSVVLILQDVPSDAGAPSADRGVGEKMLRESLRLPAK